MKKYLMILLSLAFCWVISISPAVFAEGDRTHNHNELTESHDVENHTHEHKYEDESHHDEAEDARGDGHENHEDEHGDQRNEGADNGRHRCDVDGVGIGDETAHRSAGAHGALDLLPCGCR